MGQTTRYDIGQIGERATCEFYKKLGYSLVTMNYRKRIGEIDVIVKKNNLLVFVEVKSVSCETFVSEEYRDRNPAENIHLKKQVRLRKTIAIFLEEYAPHNVSWRFDVAIVQVNTALKTARVETLTDIIL